MNGALTEVASRFAAHAALFEAFAQLLSDPLFFVDAEEDLAGCNLPALQATGMEHFEALRERSGGKVSSLFARETGCFVPDRERWMGPLGEGSPMVMLEGADGGKHLYRLRVQPVVLNGDTLYMVLLNDMVMLQRAKKAQEYFESFKQQFLTNISHEFRTPMNSIIGFAGLLEQTEADPLQREYIGHIQNSAGAMLENVENLLDLMQVESGTQSVEREPFRTYERFEAFAHAIVPQAEGKRISLFFLIDPHLPASLMGDSEKILKVLRALISNALKFTSAGGQVLVELKVLDLGRKTTVRYSVTDTGEGIAKEQLQTLLRPFASTRENQIRGKEGFGVGLTLAHKLLKMMGSELNVASEVGKGSRFSFTLNHPRIAPAPFTPAAGSKMALWCEDGSDVVQQKILKKYLKYFGVDAEEVAGPMSEKLDGMDALFMVGHTFSRSRLVALKERYPDLPIVQVVPAEQASAYLGAADLMEGMVTYPVLPTKLYGALSIIWKQAPKALFGSEQGGKAPAAGGEILVAEDNPINQKLIRTILEQQGYAVTVADNGQMAVDLYTAQPFDLVVMDIDMPVMDGISATRALREIDRRDKRPFTPVIALTARALAGDRERIIGAGLDAHLSKPVDREFLLQTLEQYLKMKAERNRKLPPSV